MGRSEERTDPDSFPDCRRYFPADMQKPGLETPSPVLRYLGQPYRQEQDLPTCMLLFLEKFSASDR